MSDCNIKLKPCPFCGGEAIFKVLRSDALANGRIVFDFIIACTKCEIYVGPSRSTIVGMDKDGNFVEENNARADLAKIWNRRANGKE